MGSLHSSLRVCRRCLLVHRPTRWTALKWALRLAPVPGAKITLRDRLDFLRCVVFGHVFPKQED